MQTNLKKYCSRALLSCAHLSWLLALRGFVGAVLSARFCRRAFVLRAFVTAPSPSLSHDLEKEAEQSFSVLSMSQIEEPLTASSVAEAVVPVLEEVIEAQQQQSFGN